MFQLFSNNVFVWVSKKNTALFLIELLCSILQQIL
jgi:hypothetical protein